MLIYGIDKALCEWASINLFGTNDVFDEKCVAIGVAKGCDLKAAVIYSNYQPNVSIEMSIYSVDKTWATRHNIRQFFMYPFTQLGLERVQATCSAQNEGVIVFLKKLGFTKEGYHRKAHVLGGDSMSFGMLRNECKWIR